MATRHYTDVQLGHRTERAVAKFLRNRLGWDAQATQGHGPDIIADSLSGRWAIEVKHGTKDRLMRHGPCICAHRHKGWWRTYEATPPGRRVLGVNATENGGAFYWAEWYPELAGWGLCGPGHDLFPQLAYYPAAKMSVWGLVLRNWRKYAITRPLPCEPTEEDIRRFKGRIRELREARCHAT